MENTTIKVLALRAGEEAKVEEIGIELEDLQKFVGGYIETVYYPFEENGGCLVCNEEGKLNGLELNRGIYNEDGTLLDIIAGDAFICGLGEEDFISLTDAQIETFKKLFGSPEVFIRTGNRIVGIKC